MLSNINKQDNGLSLKFKNMNLKFSTITALLFFYIICLYGLRKINTDSPYLDGLSITNYPIIDGSTSTLPLNRVIACELMGLNYHWQENKNSSSGINTWSIEPKIKGSLKQKFNNLILSSQTHNSFINLIDNKVISHLPPGRCLR